MSLRGSGGPEAIWSPEPTLGGHQIASHKSLAMTVGVAGIATRQQPSVIARSRRIWAGSKQSGIPRELEYRCVPDCFPPEDEAGRTGVAEKRSSQ